MTDVLSKALGKLRPLSSKKGSAVIWAIAITALVTTLGFSLLSSVLLENGVVQNETRSAEALYIARAGISRAKAELRLDNLWDGVDSVEFGLGTYSVTVNHLDSSTKQVVSVGRSEGAEKTVTVTLDLGNPAVTGDESMVEYTWREL